jgi:hypothetical protein
MSDDELAVPYALIEGRLVHAWELQEAPPCGASCPGCHEPVAFVRSTQWIDDKGRTRNRRKYFAHHPHHDGTSACGGESRVHNAAKRLVAQTINDWVDGGPAPHLTTKCKCGADVHRYLEMPVMSAHVEYRELEESRRVPDVYVETATRGAAIEILHSNRLNADRIAEYERLLDWWVEIDAHAVVANPSVWRVVRWSLGTIEICPTCFDVVLLEVYQKSCNANGQLQSIRKQVDEEQRKLSDLSIDIIRTKMESERVRDALASLVKEKTEIEASLNGLSARQADLDRIETSIGEREEELDRLSRDLGIVRDEIPRLGGVEKLRTDVEEYTAMKRSLQSECRTLTNVNADENRKIKTAETRRKDAEAAANDALRRIPDEVKLRFYRELQETAKLNNFNPGWAFHRYKDAYGHPPPFPSSNDSDAEILASFPKPLPRPPF